MSLSDYDKQANEFLAHVNYLKTTAESVIPQARELLVASVAPASYSSRESAAELSLRHLSERIEDLMLIHDNLQKSIGMPTRYASFFKTLERSACS